MTSLTPLSQLRRGAGGRIAAIDDADTLLAQDLADVGFFVGETVEVLERGALGGTPLAVRLGNTIIAIRLREAAAIRVEAA